ncbi:MAG: SGNH/GDSL hydrolase family protein [Lentisphaerae bacterium]|nr:SGNH/GDSL hydrolase family protein [Lentisphaerota bacterium]MBT4815816.1 SGNH/GDSL hydrolase family protein [Lentisphaerota bacterium]MBT5606221.1 SGNH/GDSL hydrolase family protein [Lentisphaerota bacterium]MBT7057417.1 SGNH/GDSL hydrolase family protein [Lentisphaerota bacterium]MBT7841288.1 SGNH/GDSL hydrolase family protein [Lentisphaerota bacterium]
MPILTTVVLAAGLSAAPYTHDPKLAEECRPRDGLPNTFARIQAGGPVRIAYLGGSITAAKGWRVKTMAWFRKQFPDASFEEINASISGTGSDFSACRLGTDVLNRSPDLIFLECRVNGHGGFPLQSVEGIVRQVWRSHPNTDICFVYTIGTWMVKELQAGKTPGFGVVMETVANRYGIPTIDMGIEIAKQEAAGTMVHKAPGPVEGKTVFSRDGVHPGDAGHGIYRDVVARSILAMKGAAGRRPHALGEKMHEHCWEEASLLPIEKAQLSSGWSPVDVATDPVYRDSFGRTKAMLRDTVKCSEVGESITVRWNGTTVGFSDIPHVGPMVIEARIDETTTKLFKRTQREMHRKYSRFFYLPELPHGEHTVTFTIKELPEGASLYAGQFLIVGTPRHPNTPAPK